MISCPESVDLAVEQLYMGYDEWLAEEDGVCVYVDFRFATRELCEEYQRQVHNDATNTIHFCQFGASHGPFPRSVRTYFPLTHEKYPDVDYEKPGEELFIDKVVPKSAAREEKRKKKQTIREKRVAPY
jgi:hypothetical protein